MSADVYDFYYLCYFTYSHQFNKEDRYTMHHKKAVEPERAVFGGNYDQIFPHLLCVLGYAAAFTAFSVLLFL